MIFLELTENQKVNRLINNRIFQHVFYWVFILFFFSFFWSSDRNMLRVTFFSELLNLPIKMAAVYLILVYAANGLLFKKKMALAIVTMITFMVLGGALLLFNRIEFVAPLLEPWSETAINYDRFNLMHSIIDINTVLIAPLLVKVLDNGYSMLERARRLETEMLETELKFLKNQMQPHFFFNTLNNLYSLVLKKSDKAGEVVIKLSELMRYMLYEANAPKVLFEKEIMYIKNYISLEQLRFSAQTEISFHIHGDTSGRLIEPMLILPFIENGFKHVAPTEEDISWIRAELCFEAGYFTLMVENSCSPVPSHSKQLHTDGGIGLTNIKRRLELLYPDRHELKIVDDGYIFLIKLKILS